jgi:two-component system catabolic regulation response regulator CreB
MHSRILLVEDEPSIADNIIYALRTDGFEPVWCSTGEEALAHVAPQKFALLSER